MHLTVTPTPSEKDIEDIRQPLFKFNRQHIGSIDRIPLAVFTFNDIGSKVAGLVGSTFGNWLNIDYLWVADQLRGEGMGSKLMHAAEREARARGCLYARVDTLSFQARPFYEKQGYQVQMTLNQIPEHHQWYFLTKVLQSGGLSEVN
ncbi:GNAT family N-acetyltransferase [Acerihabitans sp. TG2]|uniref:GNAT family N-acetyltransferase n=1 Tax=Acerihabitans sp. TG2 TaxID=3096008 RepID=UPI002B22652A|nr:GNAT family N-acetyltransferase [Acerihabitans sp. TG2]MEA9393566.1 GNAT family N-acetyltransferase [Acerihabitans sp. TG2]